MWDNEITLQINFLLKMLLVGFQTLGEYGHRGFELQNPNILINCFIEYEEFNKNSHQYSESY